MQWIRNGTIKLQNCEFCFLSLVSTNFLYFVTPIFVPIASLNLCIWPKILQKSVAFCRIPTIFTHWNYFEYHTLHSFRIPLNNCSAGNYRIFFPTNFYVVILLFCKNNITSFPFCTFNSRVYNNLQTLVNYICAQATIIFNENIFYLLASFLLLGK